MKKILSLIIIVVAMFAADNAMAQKGKLVGQWQMDIKEFAQMSEDLAMLCASGVDYEGSIVLNLEKKGKGAFCADASFSSEVEEGITIEMAMALLFDLKWNFKKDTLMLEYVDANVDIKSIKLTPSDPEFEQMSSVMMAVLEQQLTEEIMSDGINNDNDLKVEFVDNDTIKVVGSNNYHATLKRVK